MEGVRNVVAVIALILAFVNWFGIRPIHIKNFLWKNRGGVFTALYLSWEILTLGSLIYLFGYRAFAVPNFAPGITMKVVGIFILFAGVDYVFLRRYFPTVTAKPRQHRVYLAIGLTFVLAIIGSSIYDAVAYNLYRWYLSVSVSLSFLIGCFHSKIGEILLKIGDRVIRTGRYILK